MVVMMPAKSAGRWLLPKFRPLGAKCRKQVVDEGGCLVPYACRKKTRAVKVKPELQRVADQAREP